MKEREKKHSVLIGRKKKRGLCPKGGRGKTQSRAGTLYPEKARGRGRKKKKDKMKGKKRIFSSMRGNTDVSSARRKKKNLSWVREAMIDGSQEGAKNTHHWGREGKGTNPAAKFWGEENHNNNKLRRNGAGFGLPARNPGKVETKTPLEEEKKKEYPEHNFFPSRGKKGPMKGGGSLKMNR